MYHYYYYYYYYYYYRYYYYSSHYHHRLRTALRRTGGSHGASPSWLPPCPRSGSSASPTRSSFHPSFHAICFVLIKNYFLILFQFFSLICVQFTRHYLTPRHTTPHYTTPHHTTQRHTTLHNATPHYTTPHRGWWSSSCRS